MTSNGTSLVCFKEECEHGQFSCESEGGRCVEVAYMCDSIPDCLGMSYPTLAFDESNCTG